MIVGILFLAVCCILNELIKYLDRRDHDEPAPRKVKVWLVPLLAVLILGPLMAFGVLYSLFFYSFAEITNLLDFKQYDDLFVFSIFIISGFLIFETLINPLLVTFVRLTSGKQVSAYTKNAITITADSLIIYLIALMFNGIYIKSYLAALSISVFYHIIEWILTWISDYLKKRKNTPMN